MITEFAVYVELRVQTLSRSLAISISTFWRDISQLLASALCFVWRISLLFHFSSMICHYGKLFLQLAVDGTDVAHLLVRTDDRKVGLILLILFAETALWTALPIAICFFPCQLPFVTWPTPDFEIRSFPSNFLSWGFTWCRAEMRRVSDQGLSEVRTVSRVFVWWLRFETIK